LGERDDIVVCLGREGGRFSAVVKGSRGGKSRLAGLLEPPVELEGSIRAGASLEALSHLQLRRAFAPLRQHLEALLAAGFLCRLFLESLPDRSPAEGVYDLLGDLLEALSEGSPVVTAGLLGQGRLLAELGLEPEIDVCVSCGSPQVRGFSPPDGGMLCSSCYAGSGFAVASSTLEGLRELRAAPLRGTAWPALEPAAVRAIGHIYKLQLQQHLGLPDRVFRPVLPKRPL
jgi:DNA repair protein RecO